MVVAIPKIYLENKNGKKFNLGPHTVEVNFSNVTNSYSLRYLIVQDFDFHIVKKL